MTIEHSLPYVLGYLDQRRLGPRKVALLMLVWKLQEGRADPVRLGPTRIAKVGKRSLRQAKEDVKVLGELQKLGMVARFASQGGRLPDSWALLEINHWDNKRVPWVGEKKVLISFFSDPLQAGPIPLWTGRAGQDHWNMIRGVDSDDDLGTGASVGDPSVKKSDPSVKKSRPGQTPGRPVPNEAGGTQGSQLPGSSNEELTLSREGERQRREELRRKRETLGWVLNEVESAIKCKIIANSTVEEDVLAGAWDLRDNPAKIRDHIQALRAKKVTMAVDAGAHFQRLPSIPQFRCPRCEDRGFYWDKGMRMFCVHQGQEAAS